MNEYITQLLGYIGLDVDRSGFDEADESVASIHKGMLGIIAVAGAMSAAVGAAAFSLVNEFTESAVEVDTFAKRLGVTTQQLQQMSYAASTYGIEQDALVDGMKELSLRTSEFAKTGEGGSADAFKRLGLGQKELAGLTNDTNALFDTLLVKLRTVTDAAERQSLADQLFGGAGEQFIPLLTASGESIAQLKQEAIDLGLVMSEDSVKAAKEYSLEMKRIGGVVTGVKNSIATALLPTFLDMTKAFREFLSNHSKEIIGAITVAFQALGYAIKGVAVAAALMLPYLVGSAAISAWRTMIGLVAALRGGFLLLRTGALAAWAAAYLGPALVGAAILGIIAIAQDVYTYFNGGKSVTGLIVKKFSEAAEVVKQKWEALKVWFGTLFADIARQLADMLPDWVKKIIDSGGVIDVSAARKDTVSVDYNGAGVPPFAQPANNGYFNNGIGMSMGIPAPSPYSSAPLPAGATTNNNGQTIINQVGKVEVNGVNDPADFANNFNSHMRRNNATVIKNTNTGQDY